MTQHVPSLMNPCNTYSSLHCRTFGVRAVVWWCVAVLVCVLWMSAHQHTGVRAEFAANPLNILDPDHTLVLNGNVGNDQAGKSVAGVGDMNGDGVDDFVVGAPGAYSSIGGAFLLFGTSPRSAWEPNPLQLSTLNGTNGVAFMGVSNSRLGYSVAGVGDVNGDGVNDMLLGTKFSDVAFLVFGRNGTWPDLVDLNGVFDGVKITGMTNDRTGRSVASAGDVNNDGIPDMAIGAPDAIQDGVTVGRMDVLFGRSAGTAWNPINVPADADFSVFGEGNAESCGSAVSGVGDVNGDGVADVAVGCSNVGIVAVVYGSTAFPVQLLRSDVNGTNGFVVNGVAGTIGGALASVGDVNADGLPDFAIGAPDAMPDGEVYVLFGRNASVPVWPASVELSSLDGNNGTVLRGAFESDSAGRSLSAAGDVNLDGMDDFLVGVTDGAVLMYGRAVWPAVQDLEVNNSSAMFQGSAGGQNCGISVSSVGDVDADGQGDFAIGCSMADTPMQDSGQTGVVFNPFSPVPTTSPPTASPTTAIPTTSSPTATPTTSSPNTASPTNPPVSAAPTPIAPVTPTCNTEGAFVPTGAACVNGVLVTSTNVTVPTGVSSVATSITVVGGASFEQPVGSTLVFVATGGGSTGAGQSTSIAVQGGGCATVSGDAVVSFTSDPSNGGVDSTTGPLVLMTADCLMGEFGAVSATTSFEGDECVAVGDGAQEASGGSISVIFDVSSTCSRNSSGLSTGAIVGIVVACVVVTAVVVIVGVKLSMRARYRRANADVKLGQIRNRGQ